MQREPTTLPGTVKLAKPGYELNVLWIQGVKNDTTNLDLTLLYVTLPLLYVG